MSTRRTLVDVAVSQRGGEVQPRVSATVGPPLVIDANLSCYQLVGIATRMQYKIVQIFQYEVVIFVARLTIEQEGVANARAQRCSLQAQRLHLPSHPWIRR